MSDTEDIPRSAAMPGPDARFATALSYGWRIGFALLAVTYGLYVACVVEPHVPRADLPKYWHLPCNEYVKQTSTPTGWAWLRTAAKGDMANLVGVAWLLLLTLIGLLAALPSYWREGDKTYAAFAVLEILVLALAAWGVMS